MLVQVPPSSTSAASVFQSPHRVGQLFQPLVQFVEAFVHGLELAANDLHDVGLRCGMRWLAFAQQLLRFFRLAAQPLGGITHADRIQVVGGGAQVLEPFLQLGAFVGSHLWSWSIGTLWSGVPLMHFALALSVHFIQLLRDLVGTLVFPTLLQFIDLAF